MTSNLFEKHKESLAAAELLQKKNYYSSTVNRAYYGCFQFLLDVVFTRLNVNHQTLKVKEGKIEKERMVGHQNWLSMN